MGVFENGQGKDHEHDERDDFLNDLQLHQREGPTHFLGTDAVGGYLKAVLEEGKPPAHEHNGPDRRGTVAALLAEDFEMTVPGHCHKCIGKQQ